MKAEVLRFLVAGAVNTGVGYLVYLALLLVVPYAVAYSLSYAFGIVLSYALNTWFVFRQPWDWRKLAAFPLVYALQYLVGLATLTLLVEAGLASRELAPLVVIAITVPLTYFASRFVIRRGSE